MNDGGRNVLGLDVGGANLKAADASGEAHSIPFELWKHPDDLGRALEMLLALFAPFDRLALTMTAELCDCFETKREGVNAVLDAVVSVVPDSKIHVWGTDQRFHDVDRIRETPLVAAASNWLALATVAATLEPNGAGILIDVGSTTSDLIPLRDGKVAAAGFDDTSRLRAGELVYVGVRRTPLCTLGPTLPFRGADTGLAAELFATTLDVYVTLGQIRPDPIDRFTADGRPSTPEAARDRLSRVLCSDRESFSEDDARSFAESAHHVLFERLVASARRACLTTVGAPTWAVVSGSGEFLARQVAAALLPPEGRIVGLGEVWGEVASTAACAHALALLLQGMKDDEE